MGKRHIFAATFLAMLSKVVKFGQTCVGDGLVVATERTLSNLGLQLDLQNTVRFNDIRMALSCEIMQLLPKQTEIPHPVGIVISSYADIGKNVCIYQNVTIGWTRGESNPTAAKIGDDVTIYSGAVIIGDVNIGSGAVIGANSVVVDDVDKNATVAGAPAVEVESK